MGMRLEESTVMKCACYNRMDHIVPIGPCGCGCHKDYAELTAKEEVRILRAI